MNKGDMKNSVLQNLKEQWKPVVTKQYQEDPDKVRNANIDKNATEIMSNKLVKMACKRVGITGEDIKRILTEIRDEVCLESESEREKEKK